MSGFRIEMTNTCETLNSENTRIYSMLDSCQQQMNEINSIIASWPMSLSGQTAESIKSKIMNYPPILQAHFVALERLASSNRANTSGLGLVPSCDSGGVYDDSVCEERINQATSLVSYANNEIMRIQSMPSEIRSVSYVWSLGRLVNAGNATKAEYEGKRALANLYRGVLSSAYYANAVQSCNNYLSPATISATNGSVSNVVSIGAWGKALSDSYGESFKRNADRKCLAVKNVLGEGPEYDAYAAVIQAKGYITPEDIYSEEGVLSNLPGIMAKLPDAYVSEAELKSLYDATNVMIARESKESLNKLASQLHLKGETVEGWDSSSHTGKEGNHFTRRATLTHYKASPLAARLANYGLNQLKSGGLIEDAEVANNEYRNKLAYYNAFSYMSRKKDGVWSPSSEGINISLELSTGRERFSAYPNLRLVDVVYNPEMDQPRHLLDGPSCWNPQKGLASGWKMPRTICVGEAQEVASYFGGLYLDYLTEEYNPQEVNGKFVVDEFIGYATGGKLIVSYGLAHLEAYEEASKEDKLKILAQYYFDLSTYVADDLFSNVFISADFLNEEPMVSCQVKDFGSTGQLFVPTSKQLEIEYAINKYNELGPGRNLTFDQFVQDFNDNPKLATLEVTEYNYKGDSEFSQCLNETTDFVNWGSLGTIKPDGLSGHTSNYEHAASEYSDTESDSLSYAEYDRSNYF